VRITLMVIAGIFGLESSTAASDSARERPRHALRRRGVIGSGYAQTHVGVVMVLPTGLLSAEGPAAQPTREGAKLWGGGDASRCFGSRMALRDRLM